ncbi:cell division protein FtsK [Bacillus sp. Gen3]|nr:cell division protein FtsK [Bacillus sp. Gen3]
MLFEVISSAIIGGLVGYSKLVQLGAISGNDTRSIMRIATNAGLVAKDGTQIRPHRRTQKPEFTEYVFQLPQGLSARQFTEKIDRFQDGLNAKRRILDVSFADIKAIDWKGDIVAQIRELAAKKKRINKEVEIDFDGMLKFRVYNENLTDRFMYDSDLLGKMKGWEVPVGTTRTSLVQHDFDKHSHITVAGMTDYGKSVFLKNIITTLTARQSKNVHFFLIDLKGGLAFNRFRDLEQVVGVAKNPTEAYDMLIDAQSKMNERIEYLLRKNFEDIKEAGIKDRYFVIIDEAADISDSKDCQEIIKDIARRGRGAGFRLVYATQYPTNETISPQVRQNCSARLCFRLSTATASRAVLDEDGAESLPLVKGRAIYRTDRKTIVQTPLIENQFIDDTLKPNIIIKPRKEGEQHGRNNNIEGATPRKHSLIVEEIGIR